ncbi:hypothetical protein SPF06_17120 [Sinomonas sp. JGH33]|uniref:Uncharacterized protein n=1 Tax=Sinomonas terricola TaxID=3110330 RepID=A0ABU5TAA2_9MICC|nr:hypothetical protein [Sinomonas sp. JGH33]MEA5456455.1 hypothetical protein [Sinomonas sp. JGH33]
MRDVAIEPHRLRSLLASPCLGGSAGFLLEPDADALDGKGFKGAKEGSDPPDVEKRSPGLLGREDRRIGMPQGSFEERAWPCLVDDGTGKIRCGYAL